MRWLLPALAGLALAAYAGGAVGSSSADSFAGTWTVHPQPGSAWPTGATLTITVSNESAVRQIASGTGFEQRCGKSTGGSPAWYIVKWSWKPAGQAGGCTGTTQTLKDLFAFAGGGAVEMNLNPVSDGSLQGYWTNTGQFNFDNKITATQPSTSTGSHVQNELRVVAVEPDVQYHKGGSTSGAWLPVEKDTVLKQGDEISVDPDGSATLAFADNSTVVVRSTTQLKIASFFTDGGVVRTEILLRMGEVAAQVKHAEATKSDFHIQSPTANVGVRGTTFSVFVDPGGKATVVDVKQGVVTVDPARAGLATAMVTAGKEVEVTSTTISPIAPVGRADLRGGVNRIKAAALVAKVLARNNGPCKLTNPRTPGLAVRPSGNGWLVSYKVSGALKGTASWRVAGGHVTPANALAHRIARGCH